MHTHWLKPDPHSISLGLAEINDQDQRSLTDNIRPFPELKAMHPKKQLEFATSRQLIRELCEALHIPFQGIQKDEFGKPHLSGSDWQVSVSHSYPMVACAIHPLHPCGIDIESPRAQLVKIKHKFLNPEELDRCQDDLDLLCLHWSAKEALYKIHGRKSLIFAEQMALDNVSDNHLDIRLMENGQTETFKLKYERFQQYFVVYNS